MLRDFSKAVTSDVEKQRLAGLRTATEAKLRELFPFLREALAQQLKKKLWLEDIQLDISGSKSDIIALTGYIFGANRNIAATNEALAPMLKKMNFTEIRFKPNKETNNYKFYKLSTPEDGALIVWRDSQNYEAGF